MMVASATTVRLDKPAAIRRSPSPPIPFPKLGHSSRPIDDHILDEEDEPTSSGDEPQFSAIVSRDVSDFCAGANKISTEGHFGGMKSSLPGRSHEDAARTFELEHVSDPDKSDVLLHCGSDDIPTVGRRLLKWLDTSSSERRDYFFGTLYDAMIKLGKSVAEENALAALEILATGGYDPAFDELAKRIRHRPVNRAHIQLVAIAGIRSPSAGGTNRLARTVCRLLAPGGVTEYDPGLAVEVFRTLSKLEPELVSESPVPEFLSKLDGIEETAIWNSVVESLAGLKHTDSLSSVRDAALRRLDVLLSHRAPDELDNFPGVVATLFDAAARCGVPIGELLGRVETHPMRTWVLHQLVQRKLGFASTTDRIRLFAETLRCLVAQNQPKTVAEVSQLVAKQFPSDYFGLMKQLYCSAQSK